MSKKSTVKGKQRKTYNVSIFKILILSCFFAIAIGAIMLLVQTLGENYSFLPYISVNEISWGASGDPIVLYLAGVLLSIFVGSFLLLMVLRKKRIFKKKIW